MLDLSITKNSVRKYYGQTLQTSRDLQTARGPMTRPGLC